MNNNYLEKLEYNQIINILSNNCITYIGKNYVQDLKPSNKIDEVRAMLDETNEATSILYKSSNIPISEIADITVYLKILESGGSLTLKAILDLTKILNVKGSFTSNLSGSSILL